MIWTLGAITLLFVFTGTGFAADPSAPATTMLPVAVWTPFLIALVPSTLNYVKRVVPPKYNALLLLAAPTLGAVADALITWLTGYSVTTGGTVAALGAGALGVFLRELTNQVRKASWTPDSWTPPEEENRPPS